MPRGRKAGSGTPGPHIVQGRVLKARRETMPDLLPHERTQTAFAARMGVSQSYLGQLERGIVNLGNYDLGWFERNAPFYGWSKDDMLAALGIDLIRGVKLAPQVHRAREERFVRFGKVPFFGSDAPDSDVLGVPAGEAWLEDDGFLRKHPHGYYVRIDDDHLEPQFPKGWFAAVVPDAALAQPKMPVLVWLEGRRLVRYLLRIDGAEILLFQSNPPPNESRVLVAPSRVQVLGVVVDIKREVQTGRVPRLTTREIMAVLELERPDLLEELDL